ncbi:GPW/gp25 family protein [Hyalangium versicolor]|uniref:GPW/gp25 family protein n=1 Tax=Hyalangium versicolor TaxID=2861190 RepID=UPI001CCFAC8C|nr:GPW/gp25 family protein [Hyalangium versicolor]
MSSLRFLGKGWGFPVKPGADGALPLAEGPEKVAESIRIILDTEPGERIMRPSFGCGLRRYLMRPNSSATRALIRHDVESALTSFEPRIQLTEVRVDPGDDPAMVLIRIAYVHVRDGRPGNLVYPFYLQ